MAFIITVVNRAAVLALVLASQASYADIPWCQPESKSITLQGTTTAAGRKIDGTALYTVVFDTQGLVRSIELIQASSELLCMVGKRYIDSKIVLESQCFCQQKLSIIWKGSRS